jgi:hypothetical protein
MTMALWEPEENEMADTKDSKTVTVGGESVTVSSAPGWTNWKTLIFGALLVILGGIQQADLAVFLPDAWVGVGMALVGAVVIFLRSQTAGPMGSDVTVKKV